MIAAVMIVVGLYDWCIIDLILGYRMLLHIPRGRRSVAMIFEQKSEAKFNAILWQCLKIALEIMKIA